MWFKLAIEQKKAFLEKIAVHSTEIREFVFGETVLFHLKAKIDYEHFSELEQAHCFIPEHPYILADRARQPEKIYHVAGVNFSDQHFQCIAGPCSAESFSQLSTVADCLVTTKTRFLRAGAFKPRTSPYAFQGLGQQALEYLGEIKKSFDLNIVTEVMDPRDIPLVSEYADVLQIGSRNMHNTALLKAVARSGKPILLKRGLSASYEEFLLAAEYILYEGNPTVILCERGIRTFQDKTRNVLDLAGVALLKRLTHLPVIVDPSHATGLSELVPIMSIAAYVAGANGLMVEIHPEPEKSISDPRQAIDLSSYENLVEKLQAYAAVEGRLINA